MNRVKLLSLSTLLVSTLLFACAGKTQKAKVQAQESIEWATCNVGEKGQFVSSSEEYGNLYTWEEAQNVCPEGWRLPTKKELEALGEGSYITKNGVNGREFGNGDDKIFLPAYGFISSGSSSIYFYKEDGYYWSSDTDKESFYGPCVFLVFRNNMSSVTSGSGESRMSVRCVRDK